MNTKYDSLLNKNIANAELFIKKKGLKKSLYEYFIILGIALSLLFFGSYFSQTIGQLFIRYTKFNLITFLFKFLPLFIFVYLWIKHKFKLTEILSLFGLYDDNFKRTIKKISLYFLIVTLLLILLTIIFMNPPMYISSKLAMVSNDPNAIMNWQQPIKDVLNEYYHQLYEVAFLEEIFFRGYIQYFSFFFMLYFFRNILKIKGQQINQSLNLFISSIASISISVIVFILFHNSYLTNSLQVSSSMYKITFLIYLIGAIISALIINRTGNLWFAIFFHAAWNSLQFISTSMLIANYQVIMTFMGSAMLNGGAPQELVNTIIQLFVSIVS